MKKRIIVVNWGDYVKKIFLGNNGKNKEKISAVLEKVLFFIRKMKNRNFTGDKKSKSRVCPNAGAIADIEFCLVLFVDT